MKDTQKPAEFSNPDISRKLLRVMGMVIVVDLLTLLAGISFFMIIHGIVFAVFWLAPYWKFPRSIFFKVSGFPDKFQLVKKRRITWWQAIILVLKVLTILAFLGSGLWLLVRSGFYGQNLIWLTLNN